MGNLKHLMTLRKGVKEWNRLREKFPDAEPDLSGEYLSQLDLSGVDFVGVNLAGAKLERSNLNGADLTKANLIGAECNEITMAYADLSYANISNGIFLDADLSGINLCEARCIATNFSRAKLGNGNLRYADLSYADISYADLDSVDLGFATLHWTNLSYTNCTNALFQDARFGNTVLGGTILIDTKGLESCEHTGPSIINIQTLINSQTLPLNFLRGCGLPDTLIEYLPSLLNDPIQFYSCFISYSSQDHMFANRLHADLQNKGVRCWFAPHDMRIGDKIRPRIDESIRLHDKLLLVLSEASVSSPWVEQEVETALSKERERGREVLFPVRLDDSVMEMKDGWPALIKNSRHIGNFCAWKDHDSYQEGLSRLLNDLKADT